MHHWRVFLCLATPIYHMCCFDSTTNFVPENRTLQVLIFHCSILINWLLSSHRKCFGRLQAPKFRGWSIGNLFMYDKWVHQCGVAGCGSRTPAKSYMESRHNRFQNDGNFFACYGAYHHMCSSTYHVVDDTQYTRREALERVLHSCHLPYAVNVFIV